MELTTERVRVRLLDPERSSGVFRAEILLAPRAPAPPMHRHPSQVESVAVVAGELAIRLGRSRRTLRAGDRLSIGQDEWHTVFNRGGEGARFVTELRPAGRSRAFFSDLALLTRGRLDPLRIAALFSRHRDEVELRRPLALLVSAIAAGARMSGRDDEPGAGMSGRDDEPGAGGEGHE